MKVADILKNERKTFGFELLPPLKGDSIDALLETVEALGPFNPAYVNITYHQPNLRKRPGTVAIAAALQARYGIEVVPHLICSGFTKCDTEDALIDLSFLGIKNVLALRGDAPKGDKYRVAEGGNARALDLVRQIVDMNSGLYIDDNGAKSDFCIGVAGYPEKHTLAKDMGSDIVNLKAKVDAGGEYVVTQMFFDNSKFFEYVKLCREAGIKVPIVAGLKPLSTYGQLELLPQTFGIDLPEELVAEVEKCKDNSKGVRQVGIEWAKMQVKELLDNDFPLHFYTMGKSSNVVEVLKNFY